MLTNFKDCGIAEEFSIHCLFAYNKAEADWQVYEKTRRSGAVQPTHAGTR